MNKKWAIPSAVTALAIMGSVAWMAPGVAGKSDQPPAIDRPMEQLLEESFNEVLQACQEKAPEGVDLWQPGGCVDVAYAGSNDEFYSAISAETMSLMEKRANELDQAWHASEKNQQLMAESDQCFMSAYPGMGEWVEEVVDRRAGQLVGADEGVGYEDYLFFKGDEATLLTAKQESEIKRYTAEVQSTFDACNAEYKKALDQRWLERDRQLISEFSELGDAVRELANGAN